MFLVKFVLSTILDFFENLFIILVTHTIAIIALLAVIYVLKDTNNIQEILNKITFQNFKIMYLYFIVNATLFLTLHNLIFRGIIGPITIIVAVFIYAAVVKYFTGNYLLFYKNIKDPAVVILFSVYTFFIYYIGLAMYDRLASAIIYRTTKED